MSKDRQKDKTCVMCRSREGERLSTAGRWFCQPCTDSLPNVDESNNKEKLASINATYYADHQRFIDQRRELAETQAREQKLREAMEDIATYPPFEETNNGDRFYEQMRENAKTVLASLYPKEEEANE